MGMNESLREGDGYRGRKPRKKRLLQQSDVTPLGCFAVSTDLCDERPIGMAVRWVDGSKRLLFIDRNGWKLVEASMPALVSAASNWEEGTGLNTATLVKRWTTSPIGSSAQTSLNSGHTLWGISWDETDKRLYWNAWSDYDTADDPLATFGWATIDDSGGGTITAGNRVSFTSPTIPQKQIQGGVVHIPSSFANSYLSGKRLGVGFGSYRSVIANGSNGSIGPALYAIDPPSGTPAEGDSKTGGPCLMRSRIEETRQPRPSWAGSAANNFEASSDPTKWDWNTQFQQSAVWIDTGTKYGLVVAASFIGGRMNATAASGSSTSVTVTNSAHILDVQSGDSIRAATTATNDNGTHTSGSVTSIAGAQINVSSWDNGTPVAGCEVVAGGQYKNSVLHYSRMQSTGLLVYDPAHLAEVVASTRQPYDVVPANSWAQVPGMLSSIPGPVPGAYVNGSPGGGPPAPQLWFDTVESRLYAWWLAVYKAGSLGVYPLVFVYQVG